MKDLHNNLKISPLIDPAVIFAGNTTKTSKTIDTQGFDSLELAIIAGVLTDATYTATVYESDTIDGSGDMTSEAAVADADLLGTEAAVASDGTDDDDDSVVKKIGYIGTKRYVRLKIVQAAATTGGYMCAVAIQGHARNAPVA